MPEIFSIGNYIIERTLSESGSAKVFVARHKILGRATLLKVYSGGDQTLVKRFEREAKIVADLNSEAVVGIYDFGEDNGSFFISMEYIEGSNLDILLKDRHLTDEDVLNFCYQIACCTAVLHSKNYIHRDLKPENILVSHDNRIKLTDFGITLHESLNRVTSDGALLGTPLYMSPEQINNLKLTTASDVFALGVIYYQLAAGFHPFEAETYGEVFSRILTSQPRPLNELRPTLPGWFTELVKSMLQKDNHKRIKSAIELQSVFESNLPQLKSFRYETVERVIEQKPEKKILKRTGAIIILIMVAFGLIMLPGILQPPEHDPLNRQGINNTLHTGNDSLIGQNDQTLSHNSDPGHSLNGTDKSKNDKELKINNSDHSMPVKLTTVLINAFPYCKIYLDYRLIDETPMTQPYEIKPGRYLLGLQNPDYPSFTDSITIKPNANNIFNYNLDTAFVRLNLDVQPWGNVYIDGNFIGMTPLQKAIYLTRTPHFLEIKNDEYETWTDTLRFDGINELKRFIVLKARTLGIKDRE